MRVLAAPALWTAISAIVGMWFALPFAILIAMSLNKLTATLLDAICASSTQSFLPFLWRYCCWVNFWMNYPLKSSLLFTVLAPAIQSHELILTPVCGSFVKSPFGLLGTGMTVILVVMTATWLYSSAKKTDCHEQDSEHAHFNHNNHLDEGILAFLSCLLSNVEHHSDCEVALIAENLNVNKKPVEVDIIGDFNLSFHTLNRITEPFIQLLPVPLLATSFSGFTETYTLRGPPHLT